MENTKMNLTEDIQKELPIYEIPQVTTYTDDTILEELGPAQAREYTGDELF